MLNADTRQPREVIDELDEARKHFTVLRTQGTQTHLTDGMVTNGLIIPILRSENAHHPGLNAIGCSHADQMAITLQGMLHMGGDDKEGHVRFHLGINQDSHRIAVDAFRHREGGFTLVAVDSAKDKNTIRELAKLKKKNPDLIRGSMVLPTFNQVHLEGCRIFAMHALNALHGFQPYVQDLHRQLYDHGRGRPAPLLSGSRWLRMYGGTHVLANQNHAFGLLPGKFFKHMQVRRPEPGEKRTLLDEAEARNPALKSEPVNKRKQTLRQRFESQIPEKAFENFSRADRTASLDNKRLMLIDRALGHYEGLARAAESSP